MEKKYIKTLNHIQRCLEFDELSDSMPPLGFTLAQYRINCEWLHENKYIEAIFNDDYCVVTLASLTNKGKAELNDYHDELLEKISDIATRNELSTIQDEVLCKINARIFSKDWDRIDEIEVLEAITDITRSKNPKITTEQITKDLLEYIVEMPSASKLAFEIFIWLMKIYVILRYRFHGDKYYSEVVFPILLDALLFIKKNIYGKGNEESLNKLYKEISDDSTICITILDNLRQNDYYEYSNYINNDCNMHNEEEYQALLKKIQELEQALHEKDEKILILESKLKEKEDDVQKLEQKLQEKETLLIDESEELEQDRKFILGEVKENIYPAEIRSYIMAELIRLNSNGKINETYKAAIIIRNTTCFGSPASLQNTKMKGTEIFDAGRYYDLCAEINCLFQHIGLDIRIRCKYKNSDKVFTPIADWDTIRAKYPKHEKKLPNTP